MATVQGSIVRVATDQVPIGRVATGREATDREEIAVGVGDDAIDPPDARSIV